jgi:hypothetical protein
MPTGEGDVFYPVPWASDAKRSVLSSPGTCKQALKAAGLKVVSEVDQGDFALGFFKQTKAETATAKTPPPLGRHILMGQEAQTKYGNMMRAVMEGKIALFELLAYEI